MSDFRETPLWKHAFGEPRADISADEQSFFRLHLEAARERAKELVAHIAADMPGYTIHDVTHLDALWETASLVASPGLGLNPPEAFVFGCAVLLHDAGMTLAAYPGGLSELKQTVDWRDAIALEGYPPVVAGNVPSAPPPEVELKVKTEVLRRLHASKAAELATQGWDEASDGSTSAGKLHLIESTDLRRFYGPSIGLLAHSHWWSVSRVEQELNRSLGPMPPQTRHSVDLLKIAGLLRVADVLHLDRRRAPHFIRALERPSGVSGQHWTFQEKLAFPTVSDGAVIFTAGEPFRIGEAEGWWQAYDAFVLADRELRDTDLLLRDHDRSGLAAQRVRGAGNPRELVNYIRCSGWKPVETHVSVSDVPKIVETFGGSQLYGNEPYAPLRELLQNAIDAVEARRKIQNRASDWGIVRCELFERDGSVWLSVEDTGVGMSERVLTEVLLDFGSSLWRSTKIAEEFPGLAASGMKAIGRYGVGFFSVFMLGNEVNVITRRYDKGDSDALKLEFRQGLASRPILSTAPIGQAPIDGGTRVEIRLAKDPRGDHLNFATKDGVERSSIYYVWRPPVFKELSRLVGWLAPASQVSIETDQFGAKETAVRANDWLTLSVGDFIKRLNYYPTEREYAEGLLTVIRSKEGVVYGRAALTPREHYWGHGGCLVVGGLRSQPISHFLGLMTGEPINAARDQGRALVPPPVLADWCTQQAKLVEASDMSAYEKACCAELVLQFGGDVGGLPVVRKGDTWFNFAQLEHYLSGVTSCRYHIGPISFDEDRDSVPKWEFDASFKLSDEILTLPMAPSSSGSKSSQIERRMKLIMQKLLGEVEAYEEESIIVGVVGGYSDIERTVDVLARPEPEDG